MSEAVELILRVGAIPSFSYYENRLHPLIRDILGEIPGVQMVSVAENNIVVVIPGVSDRRPVALTAHLDKIDHYRTGNKLLEVFVRGDKIVGPMDDSVGLGLCLAVARASTRHRFPPLVLLLSEQEECGRAGAQRISRHILEHGPLPAAVITLDTTPLFCGRAGLAIYCAPWEKSGRAASPELMARTATLRDEFIALAPELQVANNSNDYVTYGSYLNQGYGEPIPSIALEPSIYPYHRQHEEVFIADILRLEQLLLAFLSACSCRHDRDSPDAEPGAVSDLPA